MRRKCVWKGTVNGLAEEETHDARIGADFAGAARAKEAPVLYHCINRPLLGDALQPTCVREINGVTDTFLFAATHLTKALAFAFDYHATEPGIIRNGGIKGTPDEYAIVCNRGKTLGQLPSIKVYAFAADGFQHVDPGWDSRQCVSTQAVPLSKARLVLETSSVDDLMRHGLQIFSTDKTFDELGRQQFLDRDSTLPTTEWLAGLLKSGAFRWENHQRGLSPNLVLKRALMPALVLTPRT